jgi:hypothetical protein
LAASSVRSEMSAASAARDPLRERYGVTIDGLLRSDLIL